MIWSDHVVEFDKIKQNILPDEVELKIKKKEMGHHPRNRK
jgi:hypothetical protein